MLCYNCNKKIEGEKVTHGLHDECFARWFGLSKIEEFKDLAAQRIGNSDAISQMNSSFFHGKFKKYSATLGNCHYILKVQQTEYPELPRTEYLCNQIAQLLEIPVPEFYLIRFQNTADTFVSRNFMSNRLSSNLIHIYRFFAGEEFNLENIIKVIEVQTKNPAAVDDFVKICLFDTLIGNHDRHGRNLALIQHPKGMDLAPFYDNPSYLAIEEDWLLTAHHEPRGKIFTTHSREPKIGEYVHEFIQLGFRKNIEHFHRMAHLETIISLVQNSYISEKRKNALQSLISRRHQELTHAL